MTPITRDELRAITDRISKDELADVGELSELLSAADATGDYRRYDERAADSNERSADRLSELLLAVDRYLEG